MEIKFSSYLNILIGEKIFTKPNYNQSDLLKWKSNIINNLNVYNITNNIDLLSYKFSFELWIIIF